jgi:hypothetical protein
MLNLINILVRLSCLNRYRQIVQKMNLDCLFIIIGVLFVCQEITMSLEQEENTNKAALASDTISQDLKDVLETDTIPPLVNISLPSYPPTISTGDITIEGTIKDYGHNIENVLVYIHSFPFNGDYVVKAALPIVQNNWSQWSVPLVINNTGTYRVVIEASNEFGDVGYAETTINAALPGKNIHSNADTTERIPIIGFVRPTFTEAAYQEHGFYRFYQKYGFPPFGVNITTDLDMLTVNTPPSIAELHNDYDILNLSNLTALIPLNGTGLDDISFEGYPDAQDFWMPFIEHVKKVTPNAIVTVMRDEDVNSGHIFLNGNVSINAYDVLLLFHDEYVTQKMYDNYKRFVENGGTIIFIDGNMFYAEVRYDEDDRAISLVEGHNWKFDGKIATRSMPERWYNETRQWVGGNWLVNFIANKIIFTNNIFNYTHHEEQFVSNPEARIIIDYGIRFPEDDYIEDPSLANKTVATYTMNYGKGKVIMIGLFGELLAENDLFLQFFDNLILYEALCTDPLRPCTYTLTTPSLS